MHTLSLSFEQHDCPVYIGHGLLHNAHLLQQHISHQQIAIITNETVAPLYLAKLQQQLTIEQQDTIILPDGEHHKTLATFERIITELLEKKHYRTTTLIALGGGVVGDITGFVAACYQRGVNVIQIPTTLLAQTDAAIGGKTAVNHSLGKNLIGAFHQPQAVIIDIDTLSTLPDREFSAGLAEIIKTALIADASFFGWLENHISALQKRDKTSLVHAITRSCEIKAHIVGSDTREHHQRALLNLGHTFGHALEHITEYQRWLHGEAVAIGLSLAANVSVRCSHIKHEEAKRIISLLEKAGLPTKRPADISTEQILSALQSDKKAREEGLRFVLLKQIGTGIIGQEVAGDILQQTVQGGATQ